MLRLNKDNTDYEIDRELTGKFAIEKSAELQEKYFDLKKKYRRLEKKYKELQVEHSRLLFDMDAVIEHEVEVKCKKLKSDYDRLDKVASENVRTLDELNAEIIELKEENEELKEYKSMYEWLCK